MTGGDPDIWVCANCRSVNKLRAKQCYNCRTPKDRAAVDPSTLDPTTHGQVREIALPEFVPSRPFAMLATLLILGVAGMQAASAIVQSSVLLEFLDGGEPSASALITAGLVGLATAGVGLLALIAWSAWLSKAVRTMPALGLGYPAANGLMAFVENFLPGLNLYRVPAIVRDLVRRLDPSEGRGGVLISLAWLGLIGGFFVPRIGSFLNANGAETVDGYVQNQVVIQGVSTALVLVGAILLVALIWWIEERIDRRRKAQLEEGFVSSPDPNPLAGLPAFADVAAPSRGETPTAGTFATKPSAPPAPAAQPPAPATPTMIPGPLGLMPAAQGSEQVLNRSITAATGAGLSAEPERLPFAPKPPPVAPVAPAAPSAHVPEGPRLQLRVESAHSMIATLDGESEPISLKELHAAADALARADGAATISSAATIEARARAQEVRELLSRAGVSTTLED
jgi:hypothetical protein